MLLTKTFIENRRYIRPVGAQPGQWQPIVSVPDETPLDVQIREWVEQTGNEIVNPGQVGIHVSWEDAQFSLRCVTLGQTILYTQGPTDVRPAKSTAIGLAPVLTAGAKPSSPGAGYAVGEPADTDAGDASIEPWRDDAPAAVDFALPGTPGVPVSTRGPTITAADAPAAATPVAAVFGPATGTTIGPRRHPRGLSPLDT